MCKHPIFVFVKIVPKTHTAWSALPHPVPVSGATQPVRQRRRTPPGQRERGGSAAGYRINEAQK